MPRVLDDLSIASQNRLYGRQRIGTRARRVVRNWGQERGMASVLDGTDGQLQSLATRLTGDALRISSKIVQDQREGKGKGEENAGWVKALGLHNLSGKQTWGASLIGASSALSAFGNIKGGFDAYKDAKEQAEQIRISTEAEVAGAQKQADEVRRLEGQAQAQDIQTSIQSGTNYGQQNLREGSALRQVLDQSKREAETTASDIEARAKSLADLRKRQADLVTKKGKRERTLGIIGGLGDIATGGYNIASLAK